MLRARVVGFIEEKKNYYTHVLNYFLPCHPVQIPRRNEKKTDDDA
jgi:hypothetical protein